MTPTTIAAALRDHLDDELDDEIANGWVKTAPLEGSGVFTSEAGFLLMARTGTYLILVRELDPRLTR